MNYDADMWVLDALANDIEGFDDVCRILNSEAIGWKQEHGGPFDSEEVAQGLRQLVDKDWVQVLVPSSSKSDQLVALPRRALPEFSITEASFMLTEAGRMAHEAWSPGF